MATKLLGLFACACLAIVSIGNRASASVVNFSGSGLWNSSAPATPISAPSETWSFSFDLPDPISINPTTQATNFSFLLNGFAEPVSLTSVLFQPISNGGGFDLNFSDGYAFETFGSDLGSSLAIPLGNFSVNAGVRNDQYINACTNAANACGSGTVDITLATTPIPASLPLFATGLGALGLFGWRRQRKAAALAA